MDIIFEVDTGLGIIQSLSRRESVSFIPRVGEFVTKTGTLYVVRSVIYSLDFNNCEVILETPKRKSLREETEK